MWSKEQITNDNSYDKQDNKSSLLVVCFHANCIKMAIVVIKKYAPLPWLFGCQSLIISGNTISDHCIIRCYIGNDDVYA